MIRAAVDRIEGTIAVLVSQDDESVRVNVPLSLLPPGCREGDIVTITIDRDPQATTAARDRVSDRIDTLQHR